MSEKILIIDDEELILESLSAILTKEGYEVDCAKSGTEALDVLKQRKYDLVITDIRMPGMNGLDVVERVKGIEPDQKIMMITGYASLETAIKAQHRGVCDYLIKPIDVKVLKGSIRRALGAGQDNRAAGHPNLEDKLRDLSGYFTLLSDFTASLNVSLDVGEILSATLDRLKKIAESDIASIYLFPKVVNELYYLKNIGGMPSLAAGEGISRAIAEAGEGISEPLTISTLDDPLSGGSDHPDLHRGLILKAMEHAGASRAFVMPIMVKKRVIGLADACRSFEQPFTETDRSLLKTIINQGALALAKALSYLEMKERNKEIELIYSLSLRLNQSLKVSDSIKAICEGAVDITGASGSLLQTSFEPGSIKNFIFHRDIGFHKEMKRGSQDWLIPQAARKEAFFSNDPVLDPRVNSLALYSLGIKSLAYVPLVYEWEVLGGLTVFHKTEDRQFDERDLHLLHLFGRHAAEVLLNSQLFESVKKSREDIITEKNKMDIVLGTMADGVVTMDSSCRITFMNEAMLRMLGADIEQVIGRPCRDVFYRMHCEEACPAKAGLKQRDKHLFLETMMERDGADPLPVYISLSSIKDGDGKVIGWVKVVRDIGKIKEVEKLKDSFFHAIAHDLKAPLTSLMGFIELLSQEPSLAEKEARYLNIMKDSAASMHNIIENLLDVYRSRNSGLTVKERQVDVKALVNASVQEMEGMAKVKGVSLEGEGVDDSITTYADSDLLKRVLNNLLSNAIKNTPSGGRVRVSTRQVQAGARSDDTLPGGRGWVEISVEDTGIGIPREALTGVFEKFYTAGGRGDSGTLGTGLGLAITKEIVEAHGGRIWAESSQGGGTKFKFTIPRKAGQEGRGEATDA